MLGAGAPGRASSAIRGAPVAHPQPTGPRDGGAQAREGASMGRGASRGREQREINIYTRPSADFDKRGNV